MRPTHRRPETRPKLGALVAFVAFAIALLLLALVAAGPAYASGGVLAVTPPGPLVLTPGRGGFVGDFTIKNAGDAPLGVSRVAIRGDEGDVRSPARISARFDGGASYATLAPGESRTVTVAWMPDRDTRVRQAFGHVVITSTDDAAGEVALGFRAEAASPLPLVSQHLLSWLVFLPFVAAAIAFFAGRGARVVTAVALVVELALALFAYRAFVPELTRADGNDGLQLIERASWIRAASAEYFVGVDGASIGMVVLVALVTLAGAIVVLRDDRTSPAASAAHLGLCGAAMGVYVAQDLLLFFVFWVVMLGCAASSARGGGVKLLVFAGAGAALLLAGIIVLHASSDATFLVDGARTAHSFALPDLARVAFAHKPDVAGIAVIKLAFVALFLGFAVVTPMFPVHAWLPDAYAGASPAGGAALLAVVLPAGPYGILRVAAATLPDGLRWASGGVAAFGAVTVVWCALAAMAQRDLRRMIAYGAASQAGLCLVGIGALSAQGIAGCLAQMFTHGAALALLTLVTAAIAVRGRSTDLGALSGVLRRTPLLAGAFLFALFASVGVPALAGFWGELLVLIGAFPLHPLLAAIAAAGAVVQAAYAAYAAHRLVLGDRVLPGVGDARGAPDEKPVDLHAREVAAMAPLMVVTALLGVWPAPLFGAMAGTVRDMTTTATASGDPLG